MEIAARIRSFEISPARFVQVAWTNVFLLWLIVGTGAAVRLTDSGLGCSHWPGCERGAPLPEKNVHAFVEFGNRLVGGVVITVTLADVARRPEDAGPAGLGAEARARRSCSVRSRRRRSATSPWRATCAGPS